jgi:hypothetical protein
VEDVVLVVMIVVEVTEAPLHIVMAHLRFQNAEFAMYHFFPQCLPGTSDFAMPLVVETGVRDPLKALGDVDTRKSDDRDHATKTLEILVYDGEDANHQTYDLRLDHAVVLVFLVSTTVFVPHHLTACYTLFGVDSCERNKVRKLHVALQLRLPIFKVGGIDHVQ